MAKSTKKGAAKSKAKKPAPKGKRKGELKDAAVDHAAGGAVDAFIWFESSGGPQGAPVLQAAGAVKQKV